MTASMATPVEGPAPEAEIARHLATRGIWAAPVLIVACGLIWGVNGGLSAGFAIALVITNFLLSAAMITTAARISLAMVMASVLFGYVLRLGLITIAVLLVKDFAWVELIPLGLTLIATHLGLLFWETRHISASLAYPGLKPAQRSPGSIKE